MTHLSSLIQTLQQQQLVLQAQIVMHSLSETVSGGEGPQTTLVSSEEDYYHNLASSYLQRPNQWSRGF